MANNPHLAKTPLFFGASSKDVGAATILVHGRNQGPSDMFEIAKRIGVNGMPYIALEAADNSWYPSRFMAPFADNQPMLDYALERLDRLISMLQRMEIGRKKIVLLGFSQGACLVCEYLYRNPQAYGGVVAFTGGLIGPEGMAWSSSSQLRSTPVLMTNGDQDEWVPLQRTADTAEVFSQMGGSVQLKVFPGRSHQVNDEEIELARPILQSLLTPQKTTA